MSFSTKQQLVNQKFYQATGDTLTLSGHTRVKDIRYLSNPVITGDTQITTKKFVVDLLALSGGSVNAGNGLTKSGDTIFIGGTLSSDITIGGNGKVIRIGVTPDLSAVDAIAAIQITNTSSFLIETSDNDNFGAGINGDMNQVTLYATDTDGGVTNNLTMNSGSGTNLITNGLDISTLYFNVGSNDAPSFSGITYNGDYSANFGPRSIPDVAWVLANAGGSGSSVTVNNGLTKIGNNIVLGGILTGSTVIGDGSPGSDLSFFTDNLFLYSATQTIFIGDAIYLNSATGGSSIANVDGKISLLTSDQDINIATSTSGNTTIKSGGGYTTLRTVSSVGSLIFELNLGQTAATFTDSRTGSTTAGVEYAADYSAGFTNRSIPDVEWVLNNAGGSGSTVNAGNGLTKNANVINLGGNLSGNTVLEGSNNYTFDLNMRTGDTSSVILGALSLLPNTAVLYGGDSTGNRPVSYLGLYDTSMELTTYDYVVELAQLSLRTDLSQKKITVDATDMGVGILTRIDVIPSAITITSTEPTFAGIKYISNYGSNFTARSIPDVGFVTGFTTGLTTNAGNGLTKIGNTIVLGGSITADTYITAANIGTVLAIGDNGTPFVVVDIAAGSTSGDYTNLCKISATPGGLQLIRYRDAVGSTYDGITINNSAVGMTTQSRFDLNVSSQGSGDRAFNMFSSDQANQDNFEFGSTTPNATDAGSMGVPIAEGGFFIVKNTESSENNTIKNVLNLIRDFNSNPTSGHNGIGVGMSFIVKSENTSYADPGKINYSLTSASGDTEYGKFGFSVTKSGATTLVLELDQYGARYAGNYFANFGPRSLVDKGYVTGLTSTAFSSAQRIPYMNTGGTNFNYSSSFFFNPTLRNLVIGTSHTITSGGDYIVVGGSNTVAGGGWGIVAGENLSVTGGGGDIALFGLRNTTNKGGTLTYGTDNINQNVNSLVGGNASKIINGPAGNVGGISIGINNNPVGVGKEVLAFSSAVNISNNSGSQTAGHGALGTNSVILGGQDHNIATGSTNSGIFGGTLIKVAAGVTNTVHFPKVRLGLGTGGSLTTANANKNLIARNTTTGELEITDGSGILTGSTVDIKISTVGKGLYVKEGSNATMGVITLTGGTAVVSTTKVTANSRIFLSIQSLGTVIIPKAVGVTARSNGSNFTISSADVTDTSVISWIIFEPA